MRMRPRGFSLIEIMIALLLCVFGFFTFFSVFATSSQHAIQTRNRAVANLLAQSYLEEFEAHTYGQPAPENWKQTEDRPFRLVARGRETDFKFEKTITYQNGSFVGESDENSDLVKVVVTWNEAAGGGTGAGEKTLEVEVPVWR